MNEPLSPRDLKKIQDEAARLIPVGVYADLRKAFTPTGMPFFDFYQLMFQISRGAPYTENLRSMYKRVADRMAQVRSPVDNRPLTPVTINKIALTRAEVNKTILRLEQDRMTSIYWGEFNEVFVPLITEVARDKGIYLKATRQQGMEKWATFRPMTPKQEKVSRLRDEDPEAYALTQRLQETLDQIDERIRQRIEEAGLLVEKSFLAGRPVTVGVDPVTGEANVYDRDGEVYSKVDFMARVQQRKDSMAVAARVPTRTQVAPEELRILDERSLSLLTGDIEWDAITDDKAKQSPLTRIFPTKKIHEPSGEGRHGMKVVVAGRYRGCFLDDLVNSEGRLIEGTAYTFDVKRGVQGKIPQKSDPAEREPYVSVAEVEEEFFFGGKKHVGKKKKLFLKIDGGRPFAHLRNAIKKMACNTGAKTGCIPSLTYHSVPGSQAAAFYFEPKDFDAIKQALEGMSLSSAAVAEIKDYYKELALAEEATRTLDAYEPAALSSESLAGESFQFIKGHYADNGQWRPFGLRTKQKEALAWLDANGNAGVCALETGVGKCVTGETLILTDRGLVEIQSLQPHSAMAPDTSAPLDGWSVLVNGRKLPVVSFYYGGVKKTRRITTQSGFQIEGSLAHPLLVRRSDGSEEWVRTPQIRPGDFLCIDRQEGLFPEKPLFNTPGCDPTDPFASVPPTILQGSREQVRKFLWGHLQCWVVAGWSTSSERLAREVQILLLRFGVVARRHQEGGNHVLQIVGHDLDLYRERVECQAYTSSERACGSLIPYAGGHVEALLRYVSAPWTDYVATTDNLQLLLQAAAEAGISETNPDFQALSSLLKRNFFYDPVLHIEERLQEVFDLEVGDDSHCFVGNGIMNHNTATSIGMMLKLVRDGLAEEGASYRRPDGIDVQTNGRFLFVCPVSLRGNIKKEVRAMLSDPKVMLERLDVLTYPQFTSAVKSGKVPQALKKTPYWIAQAANASEGQRVWDAGAYVAILFDEAQVMKNPGAGVTQAAIKTYHPRKICLTASPMERSPMEAYVLAAICNNKPLYGRSQEASANRSEMRRFKERYCATVGGRIVGITQDPQLQRELHTWVKRNIFHADKTEIKEYRLPEPVVTTLPVMMPLEVEGLYRDITAQFAAIMQGAARKFGREKVDAYGALQAERVFSRPLAPIIRLLTLMANRPAAALEEIAHILDQGTFPGSTEPLPKSFLSVVKRWQTTYSPAQLREMAQVTQNPKLLAMEEFLVSKLERAQGSRALVFCDDKNLCIEAGEHLSRTVAGVHVVALSGSIHFYRSGRELTSFTIPLDQNLLQRLVKDEAEQAKILQQTEGVSSHRLPFTARPLRLHPALPAMRGVHDGYMAEEWQQFVLKEIANSNPSIKSCTLLGSVYMYGHNLQAFNTVIHLDRNHWNSESMKQRTARAWRQGQEQVVDEVTLDIAYSPDIEGAPREDADRTLDEIRASFQQMDAAIFDDIIKAAQKITLGAEWEEVAKRDASFWHLDQKVVQMLASPYLAQVKSPRERG